MCSRLVFRSIQNSVPSLIYNRFLSLTQIQSTATTKLKETSTINVEKSSTQTKKDNKKTETTIPQDKTVDSSTTTTNVSELNKIYSEKIHQIVNEISKLSLVEVMDLNELLKKTLNIQDVPIVASGGGSVLPPPAAPKKEEEEDEGVRPTSQAVFKVRLIKFDETKKVPVIKQVKDVVENINLVQAKKLVESIPQILRDNLSKADAERMKAKIEAAGGMEAKITEAVRQKGNLQNFVDQYGKLLEKRPQNANEIYRSTAEALSHEFDQDYSKITGYIQTKIDWPLSFKRLLLHRVQRDLSDNQGKLDNIANFVFDPTASIKQNRRFHIFIPTIASVERQYGSGVSALFHLQTGFFLINLLTLIVWLALIIIPYNILKSSTTSSNVTFTFSSIFTTKGYLSETILFQGSYPKEIIDEKYNLSLIYLITTYIYFIIWFIFITIRFAITYKRKLFDSILSAKLGIGFMCTFARHDYTIKTDKEKQKHMTAFHRQFLDLIENDERIESNHQNQNKIRGYKIKMVIKNLLYILLAIGLGAINWLILSSCDNPTIDCSGSIIYVAFINRLIPYFIVLLAQVEHFQYLADKLDTVGFRCILMNICTMLSFTIYFFINAPLCYETAYGQYIYILLLSDLFASLIFPILFGILFDIMCGKKSLNFDGINLHVQLSPPVLLYSQFLIWLGIYFSPLISIMILINILFSFISHRLYIYIRSLGSSSYKRVLFWNAHRLEYMIYLLAYIILIVSVTCVVVFTTQIKPSENCGPFRQLNVSYEVIEVFSNEYQSSVLWISIINFLTSPGFIYFLGAIFFVVAYKLRHEELAEKQIVFIRNSSLTNKKKLREKTVKKLHQQKKIKKEKRKHVKPKTYDDDNNIDRDEQF
ncbi:unnamed protein product [Rotaria sp. Silwood1]|nr:unnamed protein product [Rotaria sp. Silwood1]